MKTRNLQKQQNGLCQQTVKNGKLPDGWKSTSHSDKRDLLTPLNSIYLFSKTSASLIDDRENATAGGYLNFRFCMLLKGTVI